MRPLCDIHSMDHRRLFASSLMLWRLVVWASLAGIVLSLATPSTQGLATGNEPLPTRSMNFLPELDLSSRSIDATNLTQLPLCAYNCIAESCPETDIDCFCDSASKKTDIEQCTVNSCVLYQAIHARYAMETICETPVRSRVTNFIVMDVVAGCVSGCLVIARLIFKRYFFGARCLSVDDTFILVILAIGLPCIVFMVCGPALHGLGKDVWGLHPTKIVLYAKYFFASEVIYVALMTLVKLSLCLFYLSIFSVGLVSYLLWGTVVFHALFGVAFLFKLFFQCIPLSFYWNQLDILHPTTDGYCINLNDSTWAHAAINVASDIWLLGIPLSQISKLNLHWKKKVAAAVMFTTGAGATIISILRLHSIVDFNKTTNPTYDQYNLVWWSTLEVNVGITVTCLPALRLILLRLWPATFGGSGSSYPTHQGSSGQGHMPTIGSADCSTRRASEAQGQQNHHVYRDPSNPHSSAASLYKKDGAAVSVHAASTSSNTEACSRTPTLNEGGVSSEQNTGARQVISIELGDRTAHGGK